MTRSASFAMVAWLAVFSAGAAAQTPTLTAVPSQDMPEVLYVVPWKDSEQGPPLEPPRMRVDDAAALEPLDRETFLRELRYRGGAAAARSASPPGFRMP